MPAEIISLLSSSPVAPPPSASRSPELPTRAVNTSRPAAILDYTPFEADGQPRESYRRKTANAHANSRPTSGFKRTNDGAFRQDNDFLFLSDDFDTTGDLDGGVAKKPRVSPSSLRRRNISSSSLSRTKSAIVETKTREPLQPSAMKRWNSTTDPIEHSSSPNNAFGKSTRRPLDEFSSDPFASPPKDATTDNASRKRTAAKLPASPSRGSNDYNMHSSWSWPADLSNDAPKPAITAQKENQPPEGAAVIDLASDPSDDDLPPRPQVKSSKQKASWDPISSSMPEIGMSDDVVPDKRARRHDLKTIDLSSTDKSDSEDLPDLDDIDFSKLKRSKRSYSLSPKGKSKNTKKSTASKQPKTVKKSAEEKERDRKRKAEAREADAERKRIEKERAKEQRALEKEREKALAEVNKLRTDKKVSTPEMIVDLPNGLNPGFSVQVTTLLKDLDVQYENWQCRVGDVVRWRRKITAKYNDEMVHWEPCPSQVKLEDHIMVILQAPEFVSLVLGEEGNDIDSHVLNMKVNFPGKTLIYLLEGLDPWMRKNRNVRNRQFASAVRNLNPAGGNNDAAAPASSQPRRRKNAQHQEYVDEDRIEDGLLALQVLHGALIHHTAAPVETAQWIAVFTQHISTIPYRRVRDTAADAGFCMDAGQVRTGDGPRDTYVRMLQEITRVTAPIAYGVAAKYDTVGQLVRGLEREGPLALEDCRKSANKDGAFTDRTVGQAVSKRIYKIFTGRDPASTDV